MIVLIENVLRAFVLQWNCVGKKHGKFCCWRLKKIPAFDFPIIDFINLLMDILEIELCSC